MSGSTVDFVIDQSDTFQMTFTWTDSAGVPINLTGYAAELRIYADYGDESQRTVLTFKTVSGGSPNTSLTLGGAAGTIALRAEVAALTGLVFYSGWYILLAKAPDGVTISTVAEGTVTLQAGVAY